MQPIDLEAEYNNRAKVPDHPEILQGWARDAAAFRAAHADAEYDLSYGGSPRQCLDIFWPAAGRAAPMALFIHGGYWQSLDKGWVSHMARGLVAHGVAVAVPSYDLCPQVTLPVIVAQLRAATAFLLRRHPGPVFASGHSAGGHLAATLLATDWPALGLPARSVGGACALSGLFDLAPLLHTSINAKLGLDAPTAQACSLFGTKPPAGWFTAIVGGLEGPEYARQSREMARLWGGVYQTVPGAHHFDIVAPLSDPASDLVASLLRQIRPAP